MLGRSEREGLGDLKGSDAERARVGRGGSASDQPFELIYGVL